MNSNETGATAMTQPAPVEGSYSGKGSNSNLVHISRIISDHSTVLCASADCRYRASHCFTADSVTSLYCEECIAKLAATLDPPEAVAPPPEGAVLSSDAVPILGAMIVIDCEVESQRYIDGHGRVDSKTIASWNVTLAHSYEALRSQLTRAEGERAALQGALDDIVKLLVNPPQWEDDLPCINIIETDGEAEDGSEDTKTPCTGTVSYDMDSFCYRCDECGDESLDFEHFYRATLQGEVNALATKHLAIAQGMALLGGEGDVERLAGGEGAS